MKIEPYTFFGFCEYILKFYQKDGIHYLSCCNWLHKHESSFSFKTLDELKQIAVSETHSLRLYIGNYRNEVSQHEWDKNFLPCLIEYNVVEKNTLQLVKHSQTVSV